MRQLHSKRGRETQQIHCKGSVEHKKTQKENGGKKMSMCENCLHNHHCTEVGKDAVTVCAMYKEQNEDNALCIHNWEVLCCYPIEDCRNCPVRNGEPPFQSEE